MPLNTNSCSFVRVFICHLCSFSLCSFFIMLLCHCVHLSLCLCSFDIVVRIWRKLCSSDVYSVKNTNIRLFHASLASESTIQTGVGAGISKFWRKSRENIPLQPRPKNWSYLEWKGLLGGWKCVSPVWNKVTPVTQYEIQFVTRSSKVESFIIQYVCADQSWGFFGQISSVQKKSKESAEV